MDTEPAAVVVVAILEATPEGLDDAVDAVTTCIEETHKEEGCLSYALHRDTGNPNKLVMVERWRSQEDLDAHGKTPHIAALFGALAGKLAGAPVLVFTTPEPVGDPAKGIL